MFLLHRVIAGAMCDVLQIPRSKYYYEAKIKDSQEEKELTRLIKDIFKSNRNNYGQRKIKIELQKNGWQVSRRRIGHIM